MGASDMVGRLGESLERGRFVANARMTSACVVRRKGSAGARDPITGHRPVQWDQVYPIDADAGPFRIGALRGMAASYVADGATAGEYTAAVRTGHWPHDTTGLADGDVVEVLAGEQAGTFWRITESAGADQMTALRLSIRQLPCPEDWPL